ncbi:TPA: hypothetical protein ACRTTK_003108 [Aeromonas hydrophila]
MAFRQNEAINQGTERAIRRLTPSDGTPEQKAAAKALVLKLIEDYGPVVDSYPVWHPIVDLPNTYARPHDWAPTTPCENIGYHGLDHTIFLAGAIITCPYGYGHQTVLNSVAALSHPDGDFEAEEIGIPLYNLSAIPILIRFEWLCGLRPNKPIPSSVAIPKMLLKELPNWSTADYPEAWEDMKDYLMGTPAGSRSSLFVTQETGQAMKTIWNTLIKNGVFTPPRS